MTNKKISLRLQVQALFSLRVNTCASVVLSKIQACAVVLWNPSICAVVLCASMVTSCSTLGQEKETPPHRRLPLPLSNYQRNQTPAQALPQQPFTPRNVKISFVAADLPWPMAARVLSEDSGASILWSTELDGRLLSLEVVEADLVGVLQTVARRFDVELAHIGGVYYLGDIKEGDKAVLVRRVGTLSKDSIEGILRASGSNDGSSYVLEDGVVIVSDVLQVLEKIERTFNQLAAVQSPVWVLQLFLREDFSGTGSDIGFDGEISADISADLLAASSSQNVALKAELRATVSSENGYNLASPLLVLLEGEEGEISDTRSVPVPTRTVLENGAVTTSGYEKVEVGLTVKASVRSSGGDAVLSYQITTGQISGFTEGVPITSEQALKGRTTVSPGGTYVLGTLERVNTNYQRSGLLGLEQITEDRGGRLVVWATLERVAASSAAMAEPTAMSESPGGSGMPATTRSADIPTEMSEPLIEKQAA